MTGIFTNRLSIVALQYIYEIKTVSEDMRELYKIYELGHRNIHIYIII